MESTLPFASPSFFCLSNQDSSSSKLTAGALTCPFAFHWHQSLGSANFLQTPRPQSLIWSHDTLKAFLWTASCASRRAFSESGKHQATGHRVSCSLQSFRCEDHPAACSLNDLTVLLVRRKPKICHWQPRARPHDLVWLSDRAVCHRRAAFRPSTTSFEGSVSNKTNVKFGKTTSCHFHREHNAEQPRRDTHMTQRAPDFARLRINQAHLQ